MKNTNSILIQRKNRLIAVLPSLLFILIGAVICAVVYLTKAEPNRGDVLLDQAEHDVIRGSFAFAVVLGLLAVLLVRKLKNKAAKRYLKLTLKTGAVLLVIGACLMYFYTARGMTRRHYLNFHDMFHYFLGCKYFPEVSYNNFYKCILKADAEKERPRWRNKMRVRDLDTYKKTTVQKTREEADCSGFTEERWEEFRKDTDLFSRNSHSKVITDHGYNGTPFSAYVAGKISNVFEVNYKNLVVMTLLDLIGLCLMFAVLVWGFGWRIAFLCALFHTVNFADFYYHVSFFRYWWMVMLGIGLACLHRKKYGPSAVFLTISAMLNVFPLLFFAGIGLKLLYSLIRQRIIKPQYKTFLVWAVAATIVCGSISLLNSRPIERYESFFSNMSMHSGLLTTSRTGFKYNFMFRGETTKDSAVVSYRDKNKDFKKVLIPYSILVGAILLLGMGIVIRLDDFRATILGGFLLFFMLFSTVTYYFCCASILVLFWADDIGRKKGVLFIMLLFVLLTLVHVSWQASQFRGFVNNTVVTGTFTFYLAVVMVFLASETGLFADVKKFFRDIGVFFRKQIVG